MSPAVLDNALSEVYQRNMSVPSTFGTLVLVTSRRKSRVSKHTNNSDLRAGPLEQILL